MAETVASNASQINHTFLKEPIDAHGNTLLHIAIFHQDYALAAMLLLKGADPNLRNVSGYSALSAAKVLENENLIQLLKQHGGILHDYSAETLKEASAMNLKGAFEDPNNSGSKFPSHNTLNATSKRFSKKELDHKRKTHIARVPKSDFAKRFPLSQMTANELSYLGLSDLFQQLLQKPSLRIQKGDEMGLTPLMKAAFQGHLPIVNQLLNLQGIDLWALDNHHMNALMWATLGGHISVIEIMLDLPITKEKLEHVSLQGLNLLMFASFMGNHIIVRLILEKGANVNTTTIGNLSSVQLAAWALRWEAVEVLLKYGAIVPESSDWLINGLYHLYSQQPMGVSMDHKKEILKQTLSDTQFNHFLKIEMMIESKSEDKSTSSAGSSMPKLYIDSDSKFNLIQRLKNTLGLEKLLGYQEICLFIELVLKVKSEGTELDAIYVKLLDATIQLLAAVQKNTKEAYMAISAKMVHHASELIRILETKLPSILTATPTAPSEDLYGFLNQPIYLLLRQKSKALTTDLAKQLMMHSRIALGVWPPPKANLDMLKKALYLVKQCIEIVDLAKCIGAFRLVHQNLTVDVILIMH
jgi:ankyrin repeat protein